MKRTKFYKIFYNYKIVKKKKNVTKFPVAQLLFSLCLLHPFQIFKKWKILPIYIHISEWEKECQKYQSLTGHLDEKNSRNQKSF